MRRTQSLLCTSPRLRTSDCATLIPMASKPRSYRKSCASPSVSLANAEPNHFVKLILPSIIHQKQLRVPQEFIRRFGNELSAQATITVRDGLVWQMQLKKSGNETWFCNGWQEFAKYYSIGYGSFLVFEYKGNSNFCVLIFDTTSAEIYYPCQSPSNNEESNFEIQHSVCPKKRSRPDHHGYEKKSRRHKQEDEEIETIHVHKLNAPSKGESKKKVSHYQHGSLKKHETARYKQGHSRNVSSMSTRIESLILRRKQRALQAAQKFKPNNPSFIAVLSPCSMYGNYVYVSAPFAGKYLSKIGSIKIQGSDGQKWEVMCCEHQRGSAARRLGKGWCAFARENHLREGDVCVFELIKGKQIVLKVKIFHT